MNLPALVLQPDQPPGLERALVAMDGVAGHHKATLEAASCKDRGGNRIGGSAGRVAEPRD